MNIIANYLVQKILLENQKVTYEDSGKFILRNYPIETFNAILNYFLTEYHDEILILVDSRLDTTQIESRNIIEANHEVMAQYRNANVQHSSIKLEHISYIVFITNETIDTLGDIDTLTPDDLEKNFKEIIDSIENRLLEGGAREKLQNICKVLLQEIEGVDPFSLEQFIISTLDYMSHEGYPLEEAMGLSLNTLNSFRCHKCFELLKRSNSIKDIRKVVKSFRLISSALSKRVGNKTVSEEDLEERYKESQEENFSYLEKPKIALIEKFIVANSRELNKNRKEFSKLDWNSDYIYRLFEKSRSKASKKMGQDTIEILEERDSDIDDSERKVLKEYDKLKAKDRETLKHVLEPIYKKYRAYIEDNRLLRNKWDKFLYPAQTKSDDFILGLLETIKKLKSDAGSIETIEVSLNRVQATAIMRNYSKYAIAYLNKRYSILNTISQKVRFNFEFIVDIEKKLSSKKNSSTVETVIKKYKKGSFAKKANELHFIIKANSLSGDIFERKLIWKYPVKSILTGYKDDIESIEKQLSNKSLYANKVYRASNSEKGEKKSLSLFDYSSLENRGPNAGHRLFPKKCSQDMSSKTMLQSAKKYFTKEVYLKFDKLFKEYLEAYSWLLSQLDSTTKSRKKSFDFSRIENLVQLYTEISKLLFENSDSDYIKTEVIEPFLSLVTVRVEGEDSVIIPSYHPLRLVSYFVKLKQTFVFIDSYVESLESELIKEDLFFSDLEQSFSNIYYPEIFRLFDVEDDTESLLHISEICDDYTILEPIKANLDFSQNTDPTSQTAILTKVIENYLTLNRHKQSSLKILLHAVNNYEFPVKFMKKMMSLDIASDDSSFEIYLNDVNASHIRQMYRAFLSNQNSKNSEEALEYNEVSFLSNIRLNAFDQSFKQLESINDKFNIAFLSDFVSSKAILEFMKQHVETSYPIFDYHPTMWSKRKYMIESENSVGKYLISPAKSDVTSSFYNLLYLTMSSDKYKYRDKIPTLNINRRHISLCNDLEAIHKQTDWVVNIDSLLDKKILEELGANVIKYRKARHINRNLVVSSKANTILLESHLSKKFKNFKIDEKDIDRAVKNIILSANELSGDILLKAIGQGHFANDMLGLVLTKTLLRGCSSYDNILIYIDDYADWFLSSINSEEKLLLTQKHVLADILLMTPIFSNAKLTTLYIDIVEVKFCSEENRPKLSKKSLQQTIESFQQIKKVFDRNSYHDKAYWLAKISDLIVETHQKSFAEELNSENIRNAIRFDKNINFIVRGLSFVFVYNYEDDVQIESNIDDVSQYIIGSKSIANIIRSIPKCDITQFINLTLPTYQGFAKKEESSQKKSKYQQIIKEPSIIKTKENKKERIESVEENQEIHKAKKGVQEVVMYHKYRAKIKKHLFTPNTLRISLAPELGWKPKIFYNMSNDFLTVKSLELLRVEPVKGAYDLIFKRDDRQIIYYHDCLKDRELSNGFGNTKILIGRNEENNTVIYYNLDSEDPHALVAGMTKSGKSVLLNIFIIDLIRTNKVDELELILVDPKQVEFTRYRDIPYLDKNGIITKKELAIEKLNRVVDEMERRYTLFAKVGVNEINKYNKKTDNKLARIVLIFDEFADWMLDDGFKKEVSSAVQSLSGKARAAGIHLIISTQRPDNTVVVPILRANLGAKFALRVDSEKNSNIIIDEAGAEKLLGYGHMITKFAGAKQFVQTAFISDEYIDGVINEASMGVTI